MLHIWWRTENLPNSILANPNPPNPYLPLQTPQKLPPHHQCIELTMTWRHTRKRGARVMTKRKKAKGCISNPMSANCPKRTVCVESMNPDFNANRVWRFSLPVGVSRGFAFVEFSNVSDAQRWMENKKVTILTTRTSCWRHGRTKAGDLI